MGGKKKTTTQTYTPPSWVEANAQLANRIGNRIGNQQYEAYGGERIAGLSENEQQGMALARETGVGDPYYAQGAALAERGSQQFEDADMSKYMNPFIKNALDPAAREIRQEGTREANALDARATSMNAFGGSRAALMQSENREKTLQSVSDLYGKGYAQAYESAVSIWGDERTRDMQASGRFQSIGDSISNARQTDINTLMTTGATDRGIMQAMRDFDYSQFREGRDWDFRNLGGIIAALEGTRGSYSTTQTSTEESSGGELAQAMGLVATLMGAFFNPGGATTGESE